MVASARLTTIHGRPLGDRLGNRGTYRLLGTGAHHDGHVLAGLFLDRLERLLDGDDAEQPVFLVDDGEGEQVVALDQVGYDLTVGVGR